MDVGQSNWIMGKLAVATPSIKEQFFLVQQPCTVNSSSIWYRAWRSSLRIFTGILEGLIMLSSQARKKNRKTMVRFRNIWLLVEKQRILTGLKGNRIKTQRKKRQQFAKISGSLFKAKLQQEGSYDFKWGFKAKNPIQALLLSRSYCDGNDMLCGKWWFSWNGERKKFAVIDVPHEGQTTKSLTCWLSNSV